MNLNLYIFWCNKIPYISHHLSFHVIKFQQHALCFLQKGRGLSVHSSLNIVYATNLSTVLFGFAHGWNLELNRTVGTGEPLFNMNSGRLQASLDRVEAILTHTS